jgi:prepilin-type N-terminal cleavage/methylation domain-containing protein
MFRSSRSDRGFTVLELTIVVVMIVVMSSFGVPHLRDSIERARVRDAFTYMAEIAAAQNVFRDTNEGYASSLKKLELEADASEGFGFSSIRPGASGDLIDSWVIVATRKNSPVAYGSYTIAFNESGYAPGACSLAEHASIDPFAQR